MNRLFRNPELKWTLTKVALWQLLFGIALFWFIGVQLTSLSRDISYQNTALIGKLAEKYPLVVEELPAFITRKASLEEVNRGRAILKKYGYTEEMRVSMQPSLKEWDIPFRLKISALAFLAFFPLGLLLQWEYGKIYHKAGKISYAAEKVVDGDFNHLLPEDEEGDFGILGHQFNQMALRLKKSMESLKEEKLFLKDSISDISHQLKTPLSSLIMFNELMLDDTDMKEDTRTVFLQKSKAQLERMEWLIVSLLKMARLEAGAIVFKCSRTLLIIPVRKAIAVLQMKAQQKNQTIHIKGDHGHTWFTGDEDWMAEALINILKNSIEHTGIGGVIEIELSETPLFSRITVKDNGEGIAEKDIPHIFERFYRGSSAIKTESIGIGLALSRLIVEGQGGHLTVSSIQGEGTAFTATFLKGII